MSLGDFQRALCDLIAAPELCARLRAGDEGVFSGYELDGRERRRLIAVVGQRGMSVNCSLYRVNRITPIYSLLPRSCALLGDRLMVEASAFWRDTPTDMQFGPEVERFAGFLRHRVTSGELRSPYLLEVVEFELAVNELRFSPRADARAGAHVGSGGRRWVPRPLLRVVRFEHDPSVLLDELAERRVPPAGLARGDFYLAIDAGGTDLQILPLDPPVGRLLADAAAGESPDAGSPQARALIDAGMLVPA